MSIIIFKTAKDIHRLRSGHSHFDPKNNVGNHGHHHPPGHHPVAATCLATARAPRLPNIGQEKAPPQDPSVCTTPRLSPIWVTIWILREALHVKKMVNCITWSMMHCCVRHTSTSGLELCFLRNHEMFFLGCIWSFPKMEVPLNHQKNPPNPRLGYGNPISRPTPG